MCCYQTFFFFFFNDTATTEIYTLSLTTLFRSPKSEKITVTARKIYNVMLHYAQRQGAEKDRRSEEHTSELQSLAYLVCRLLLEKKKNIDTSHYTSRLLPNDVISTLRATNTRVL